MNKELQDLINEFKGSNQIDGQSLSQVWLQLRRQAGNEIGSSVWQQLNDTLCIDGLRNMLRDSLYEGLQND